MALSSELISQFVKVTRDEEQTKKESTAYGKIIKQGDTEYVQLDGSDLLTPISSTTVVKDGDRVMVTIKDHTAIVTGDFTNPSANNKDVIEIGNKITEFEIVIADKVTTEQLEAEIARIEQLRVDELKAVNAEIETLNGKVAKIDSIEADVIEVNQKITAHEGEFTTIRGEIADFKDLTAENIEAINGNFYTLESDYADFKVTTTNKITANEGYIADLEANKLSTTEAELKYANIDFSNIGEAAIEKLFSDSGIIKDLIMSDGKVTGELVGVTIKGDLIEGNTVKADKLVIQGEDGLYYKLNVNSLGETTASSDEKYQNGLDGSIIVAESITAEKIAVDDLVAFGATIGGYHITEDSLYSGVKNSVSNTTQGVFLGDDGQMAIGNANNYLKFFVDTDGVYKLELQASSIRFGANNSTIEEYVDSSKQDILKTVEGTELTIDDGMKISEFRVEGKSYQETRDGKNIFDKTKNAVNTNNAVVTQLDTGVRVSLYSDGVVSLAIYPLIKIDECIGKTIRVKCDISASSTNIPMFGIGDFTESGGGSINVTSSTSGEISYVVQESDDDATHVGLILYGTEIGTAALAGDYADFTNLIVTVDNEDMTYEEYGISPSPDYPSEIISIGYENLFEPTLVADDGNTITVANATVELDEDTFVFTCTNDTDMYFGQVANEGVVYDGTRGSLIDVSAYDIISYNVSNELFTKNFISYFDENLVSLGVTMYFKSKNTVKISDMPAGTKYITFRFGYSPATVGETYRTTVLINKGDKIHSHIPYGKYGIEVVNSSNDESSSTVLILNDKLRSLSNGTKDIAYVKNGKLYVDRYVGSTILNGTEGWNMNTGVGFHSPMLQGIVKNLGKGMSDRYIHTDLSWQGNYTFSINSTGILAISDNTCQTVAEFKTWLSENPVQVDYELAEPITEELDITTISLTENSTNILYVNDYLEPHLYCKYYTDYPELWDIIEENNNTNTDVLNDTVDGLNKRINQAETTIEILSNMIANLVTDENGGSLMTQTSNGWTFNMSSVNSNLNAIKDAMVDMENNHSASNSALEKLTDLVNDVANKTAYITMATDDNGDPCIELGKTDSIFKVRITNQAIDFLEGSTKIAYANNNTFYSETIIVKNQLQIGEGPGFVWRTRANGNMGLTYIPFSIDAELWNKFFKINSYNGSPVINSNPTLTFSGTTTNSLYANLSEEASAYSSTFDTTLYEHVAAILQPGQSISLTFYLEATNVSTCDVCFRYGSSFSPLYTNGVNGTYTLTRINDSDSTVNFQGILCRIIPTDETGYNVKLSIKSLIIS